MSDNIISFFDKLFAEFAPRGPDVSRIAGPEECQQMTSEDGLLHMTPPPMENILIGVPPTEANADSKSNTYLWVICQTSIPCMSEIGSCAESGGTRKIKHTNLTGGGAAYCGGEMWFNDSNFIYFSGASGRYTPRSSNELHLVFECFVASGYAVTCFGWDDDVNKPARELREDSTWE